MPHCFHERSVPSKLGILAVSRATRLAQNPFLAARGSSFFEYFCNIPINGLDQGRETEKLEPRQQQQADVVTSFVDEKMPKI